MRRRQHAPVLVIVLLALAVGGFAPAGRAQEAPGAEPAASDGGPDRGVGASAAAVSSAAEQLQESIRIIQQRRVVKAGKVELQVLTGAGGADVMFPHVALTGALRYHISELWSVGATGTWMRGFRSQAYDHTTEKLEVFPEESRILWYAGVDAAIVPVEGKFAAFGSAVQHFDWSYVFGVGILQTNRSDDIHPVATHGMIARLFPVSWLAIVAELKHHMYFERFRGGDEFTNAAVFQLGLSFLLPPSTTYRYAK